MSQSKWEWAVLAGLLLVGCKVSVDPTEGFYACNGPTDCVDDYQCVPLGLGGPSVCTRSCGNDSDCDNSQARCVGNMCLPTNPFEGDVCASNFDCGGNTSFCNPQLGFCEDPCLHAACGSLACQRNPTVFEGFECVNCQQNDSECSPQTACVIEGADFACRPQCFSDENCSTGNPDNSVCGEALTLGGGTTMTCLSCNCQGTGGSCSATPGVPGDAYCNRIQESSCDDFIDNDGDGRTDCQDVDCLGFGACGSGGGEICGDGIDNDGNGACDCFDSACNTHCSNWHGLQPANPGLGDLAPQPFLTNQIGTPGMQPAIAVDSSGLPVVAWADGSVLHLQRFNPSRCQFEGIGGGGDAVQTTASLPVRNPALVADDAAGVFFLFASGSSTSSIFGGRAANIIEELNSSLDASSPISDTVSGDVHNNPRAAMIAGRLVVVWGQANQLHGRTWDGSNWGYDRSYGMGAQSQYSVAGDGLGNALIVWPSTNNRLGYVVADPTNLAFGGFQHLSLTGLSYADPVSAHVVTTGNPMTVGISAGTSPNFKTGLLSLQVSPSNLSDLSFLSNVQNPDISVAHSQFLGLTLVAFVQNSSVPEIFVGEFNGSTWNTNGVSPQDDGSVGAQTPAVAVNTGADNITRTCVTWQQSGEIAVMCRNL